MALGDFLAKLGGVGQPSPEPAAPTPTPDTPTPAAPSREDLGSALAQVEAMVASGAVPSCVTARVERVTHVVRDTIPRLGAIRGSASAYSVVATATDYLPEALQGYLRLPRRFADSRPVDGGLTSLMVLVDQLDLLGATMDQVFDAVCRDDATALVAHGRFLAEKFGHAATGGALDVGTTFAVPPPPDPPGPQPSDIAAPDRGAHHEPTPDDPGPGETASAASPAPAGEPATSPPAPTGEPAASPPAPPRSILDLDAPPPDQAQRLAPPSWP